MFLSGKDVVEELNPLTDIRIVFTDQTGTSSQCCYILNVHYALRYFLTKAIRRTLHKFIFNYITY